MDSGDTLTKPVYLVPKKTHLPNSTSHISLSTLIVVGYECLYDAPNNLLSRLSKKYVYILLQKQTHCENKQLHYQLGDLEKFRKKSAKNEVLHFFAILRN